MNDLNEIDYMAWSNEYESQSNILAKKIKEKRELLSNSKSLTTKERLSTEKALVMLEEMLDECTGTMYELRRRAKKKKDGEIIC